MKVDIFIDIRERIDSRELWNELEATGCNVTDMGTHTLVHGTVPTGKITFILLVCLKYGEAIATIAPLRN